MTKVNLKFNTLLCYFCCFIFMIERIRRRRNKKMKNADAFCI